MIISPRVLGYSAHSDATWNAVIVGLLVAGLEAWAVALALRSANKRGRQRTTPVERFEL